MADKSESTADDGTAKAAAVGVAMHEASRDPGVAADVREFLREQTIVLRLQADDLRREDKLRHWSLRVRHISEVLKLSFELALASLFTVVMLVIALTVWSATQEDGVVIEAFSVPPELAAEGLTGQGVAAKLQDKLSAMQAATDSSRPAASYSNNWGGDIRVEIPDTGVSIGEFYRYLVSRLGHQTHITGEVYHIGNTIAVTARSGGDAGTTVTGTEADFDSLMQQAAEQVYARTQPYRHAIYLGEMLTGHGARERARAIFEELVASGSREDRIWGHVGLSYLVDSDDPRLASAEQRKAAALDASFALPYQDIAGDDHILGHDESTIADMRKAVQLLENGHGGMSDRAATISLPADRAILEISLGDPGAALRDSEDAASLPDFYGVAEGARELSIMTLALLHRTTEMRAAWNDLPASKDVSTNMNRANAKLQADYWSGDWSAVTAEWPGAEAATRQITSIPGYTNRYADLLLASEFLPFAACALAETGDVRGAHALIDKTPSDCYTCLRMRGSIDAAEMNWNGAAWWFADAARQGPSIPFAYADWGAMLLHRGDYDGAIAKFTLANQKGPHFADPLEMWGEALIRKNRSDLALAKFTEADKYVPNWGRLHLKWGEALLWMGKPTEARKQFAIAATLDLIPSEKVELTRMTSHV
jgi:tetratricopeptide (TPR) repeat protein